MVGPSSALLLAEAGQLHGQAIFLRRHASSGAVQRELAAAVAESATLMGQLVWDASQRRDHAASAAYFDQAISAAQQTRDIVTEANALLRKGYLALYGIKRPTAGLALTTRAAAVSHSGRWPHRSTSVTSLDDIDRAKQTVRRRIWDLLDREGATPPGVHGHIPDFASNVEAAARLAELDVWKGARVVKCNPDRAQWPVRVAALQEGKLLYTAVPKLATPKPFYLLDPKVLAAPLEAAATSTGAADIAPTVGPDEMRPVDLVVCGSVAVSRYDGVRVGKGAGYSDLEVALLTEAGLVTADTAIATTIHQIQLRDDELPCAEHDFSVDFAITPSEVLACTPSRGRPQGIVEANLRIDQRRSIPALPGAIRRNS